MDKIKLCSRLDEIYEMAPGSVKEDFEFNESNLDSLAIISIIAVVDEDYGKILDGKALANMKSVNDLITLIERS